MAYKKYIKGIFISVVTLLTAWAMIIILLDPYFHYHAPAFGLQPVVDNNRYQNPGIAEHFTYDSILIGSSMTENYRVSWLNEAFGCDTVKLSYPAGRTQNYKYMMDTAFKRGELKNVFFGLDIDPLLDGFGVNYFPIPSYLYDEDPFNDVNYLFNKSIMFGDAYKMLSRNLSGKVPSLDEAYTWDKTYTFSKEATLKDFGPLLAPNEVELPRDYYAENFTKNLGVNILPSIEAHPNTEFYIFFPPYSILFWNYRLSKGDVDAVMYLLDYTMDHLLRYENVHLFFFLDQLDIITDLDNYKDYTHHSAGINRLLVDYIKTGRCEVTHENYKAILENMESIARTFDYESLL